MRNPTSSKMGKRWSLQYWWRVVKRHKRAIIISSSLAVFGSIFWLKVASIMYVLTILASIGIIWGLFTSKTFKRHSKSTLRLFMFICFGVVILLEGFVFRSQIMNFVSPSPNTPNPYDQLFKTVTANVEVSIVSKDDIHANFIGSGGYLAFTKGSEALLVTSSTDSKGNQVGGDIVVYSGKFDMDMSTNVAQQKITYLQQAEYIQIRFASMPEKSQVISGKAIVTINSNILVEFPIPPQLMGSNFILIPDIQKYMADFNK